MSLYMLNRIKYIYIYYYINNNNNKNKYINSIKKVINIIFNSINK